ncbi:GNAT family N-acetyltransferase [Simiduia litorea]|uniref:GNAT family N-acetyltransferase n=1 Tax=Simiduia litorea TaxID=1435348 RepID=UPI0036F3D3D0
MQIDNLRNFPQAIPELAEWHYQQWATLYPEQTQWDFEQELRESLAGLNIPRTWVLCQREGDGDKVFGSASIIAQDMTTHLELTPWLASVYIHASLRGQGWGKKLINRLMDDCARAGFETVYLFTPGQEDFYQSLGWTLRKREIYQGEAVAIMSYDFAQHRKL